jgi:hypothetical protein
MRNSRTKGGKSRGMGGAGTYATAQIGGEGSLAQRVAEPCEGLVQVSPSGMGRHGLF